MTDNPYDSPSPEVDEDHLGSLCHEWSKNFVGLNSNEVAELNLRCFLVTALHVELLKGAGSQLDRNSTRALSAGNERFLQSFADTLAR